MINYKLFCIVFSVAFINSVYGLTFNVNSFNDSSDTNPSDGICLDSQGKCTIRAAIEQANSSNGLDNIFIPGGFYEITEGQINISSNISIIGEDSSIRKVNLTGKSENKDTSLFFIENDVEFSSFKNLTFFEISNFKTIIYQSTLSNLDEPSGSINIQNLEFFDNDTNLISSSGKNRSIYIKDTFADSNRGKILFSHLNDNVVIERSLFTNNESPEDQSYALFAIIAPIKSVKVYKSSFKNNSYFQNEDSSPSIIGRGIFNISFNRKNDVPFSFDMEDSEFSKNYSLGASAALQISSYYFSTSNAVNEEQVTLNIKSSIFSNNKSVRLESTSATASTVYVSTVDSANSYFQIENSLIEGNTLETGAALYLSVENINVVGTTIKDNTVTESIGNNYYTYGGLYIGGIEGDKKVLNSTVSDNSGLKSGGVYFGASAQLLSSTIYRNFGERVGGVYLKYDTEVLLSSNIIAKNTYDEDAWPSGGSSDCSAVGSAQLTSIETNLIGNMDKCENLNLLAYDIVGDENNNVNPKLTSYKYLGENALPVLLPRKNSPAVNPERLDEKCTYTEIDQTGQNRNIGESCDLGAVESHFGKLKLLNIFPEGPKIIK